MSEERYKRNSSLSRRNTTRKSSPRRSTTRKSSPRRSTTRKSSLGDKLPSKRECELLNSWHGPWSSGNKTECENKGCLHRKSPGGSYCEDPITVTNRLVEKAGLHRNLKLAAMTYDDLNYTLKSNNKAGKSYLNDLKINYHKRRQRAISDVVIYAKPNIILHLSDRKIRKIIINAEDEGFRNIKSFHEIKMVQQKRKQQLFQKNLGNFPFKYRKLTWGEVEEKLHKYGINNQDVQHDRARLNFERYSCHSPFYHVNETPYCNDDCDCNKTKKCDEVKGKCVSIILPKGSWKSTARFYNIRRGILYAQLKNNNNEWVHASIPFKEGQRFSNIDGAFKLDI